ncbi:MAG: tyrosine-type recombinase/integrase [Lachnospiraceae bacterium]|nr:tyrosine-type recombinase/integrase [Lachnospiraceae bacterium]
MSKEYKKKTNIEARKRSDIIISELPPACSEFFLAKGNLSAQSALSYSQDYKQFFKFLISEKQGLNGKNLNEIANSDLAQVTSHDAALFMQSIRDSHSIASRKHFLTSLRSLFKFLDYHGVINKNPFEYITVSDKRERHLTYLDKDEKKDFLDGIESGNGLNKHQKKYHEKNSVRDLAIIMIFLSTGIRISELVGLDLGDVDFKKHRLTVVRKGDTESEDYVYMSDEAEGALREYLDMRQSYAPAKDEKAIFLNFGRNISKEDGKKEKESAHRINVRAVQRLVKRYIEANVARQAGKITPHKLRTTFAEEMLNVTHDIERVQKLLGHSSIASTTRYVESSEEDKKSLRNLTQRE